MTHYNINWLIEKFVKDISFEYIFFWGHRKSKDGSITSSCLSQWWEAPFKVKGVTYATTEHWMMASKAILFKDNETLEKILLAKTPMEAKQFGRRVKNFNYKIWDTHSFEIVKQGNIHKFSAHPRLKEFLINTKNKVIVEASPRDRVWGIGMGKEDKNIKNPTTWQGRNLLGFALMEVRDHFEKQ